MVLRKEQNETKGVQFCVFTERLKLPPFAKEVLDIRHDPIYSRHSSQRSERVCGPTDGITGRVTVTEIEKHTYAHGVTHSVRYDAHVVQLGLSLEV